MTSSKKWPPVDADVVRQLAGLLDETGLTEIEYGSGDWHVRVGKSAQTSVVAAPVPSAALSRAGGAANEIDIPPSHPGLLTSPMVGVVYTCPEPGAPVFVREGDSVEAGDTVLLIEAMKVFNPIEAPQAGRVTRVFVANGAPVEFGEPLLIIE